LATTRKAWDQAKDGIRIAVTNASSRLLSEERQAMIRQAVGRVQPGEYLVELEPPSRDLSGLALGPPDFIGVGVQKAGTSWWFKTLVAQPGFYDQPGFRKERHFFDRFFLREFEPEDVARYEAWFPRPPGTVTGEWTPCYMHHFWVPPLLRRAAPDARILVLLRDPVDRYISGVTFSQRKGDIARYAWADDAFARGLYGTQLDRLRAAVPHDRILVQQYERCRVDAKAELARALEFLGRDGPSTVGPLDREFNRTEGPKMKLPGALEEELVARYADDVRHTFELYPDLDPELWPNVAAAAV
jgi:hypothetical protein